MSRFIVFILVANFSFAQTNMQELDERLTDIEINLLAKKLDLGLELQMFGGHLTNDNALNEKQNLDTKVFKNNIRLKVKGSLSEDFNAYISLQVSHAFNDEVQSGIDSQNNDTLTPTHGSKPYLRTAFFDWNLTENLVFSAGRLPTTFGPPEHHKAGRQRLGTYPLTSFNIPLDGLSFTYHALNSEKLSITSRTIYVPGRFDEPSAPHIGIKLSSSSPTTVAKGHEGFTQMLEFNHKERTKLYDKANFIAQYSYLNFGSFIERTAPAQIVPNINDRNIYRIYADQEKLAKIQIASFYGEFLNFLNTPFDLYYSVMRSWVSPQAKIKAEIISDGNGGTPPVGTVFELGQFISNGKSHGTRSIYGLKYNFKNSFIASEYWKTTSTPIPNDLYSDDPIALGQLSGEALHLFYTHLFYNKNLSVRTGLVDINTDKKFSTFAFEKHRQNVRLLYTSLFVTF